MLADLHTALTAPVSLIEAIYAQGQHHLDSLEHRVAATFHQLLTTPTALSQVSVPQPRPPRRPKAHHFDQSQVRSITPGSTACSLPRAGSLVRLRAMVQDTGLGGEVYRAATTAGELLMFGADEHRPESDHNASEGDGVGRAQVQYCSASCAVKRF